MSEKLDTSSLASLANAKGAVSREGPDARASSVSRQAKKRGGFDGFLKTFLGKEDTAGKTRYSQGRSTSTPKTANKAGKTFDGGPDSLAAALEGKKNDKAGKSKAAPAKEKSAPAARDDAELPADEYVDELPIPFDAIWEEPYYDASAQPTQAVQSNADIAAAAEEAARILWGLLHPGQDEATAALPEAETTALEKLAVMLNASFKGTDGLSGLGVTASGIASETMGGAVETTNVSAEMNAAAVVAALEELLGEMPRQALEEALAKTAQNLADAGREKDALLEDIARALGVEIVSAETEGEVSDSVRLLAELGKSVAVSADAPEEPEEAVRQNEAPAPEKTSGPPLPEEHIFDLFTRFLKEKNGEISSQGPINKESPDAASSAEQLVDAFAEWVLATDNSPEAKELVADRERLTNMLHAMALQGESAAAASGDPELGKLFSWLRKNLESLLRTGAGMKTPSSVEMAKPPVGTTGEASVQTQPAKTETARDNPGQGQGYVAPSPSQSVGSATPAAPNAANTGSTSSMLDQIQNIERLTEAMRMANRNGIKNITLQLSPPELGRVLVRVEARDGVVSAFLRVEKPEAAAQLSHNLAQLRENLKAQGIELAELDIRQQPQNQAMTDFGGHRHRRDSGNDVENEGGHGGSPGLDDDEDGAPAIDAAAPANRDANGNLNFFA